MKTRASLLIAMFAMMVGAFAQKPSMTLTFTADNNGQHVPLNSILVENITQGGDTTLFAPDTVLVLDYVTGIGENETNRDNVFVISQNYPNPMQGQTTVNLYLPDNGYVLITVSDIMGREVKKQEMSLNRGTHSFAFFPGRESLYFLTARLNHQSQTIKMINNPSRTSGSGTCCLEYSGEAKGSGAYKSEMFLNNFAFSLGDQLKFTGLTDLGERVITSSPAGDQTYYFHYTGDPCPGNTTVTDIDGNVYNTILIGYQCWMKENLKTTTYSNGTSIPNVTDDNSWKYLTTGAYVWYDNNISWKDKYGALYNWYAVDDPDGLCPEGWHVPSDAEWTQLTDFIGGDVWLIGNKMKSCRQFNSPLGGGCNATEHPRWDQHNIWYGTDDFGFSGHPGSMRSLYGDFSGIGGFANWWSSTEYSPYIAWSRALISINGLVYDYNFGKNSGISIRCLRNSDPSAAFTAEPTSGIAPLTVSFTDQSTNNPTSWQWDFGDSNTSTQQNPAHTYQIAGTYTVQLTVANSYGSDSEIKNNYIVVAVFPCGSATITDIDGNVYNTVLIETQCWMKENLKTTTYKNGTPIPNVTDATAWYNLTTGAYVWYNNDINWKDKYGALYNWYAVDDPNGLCPTGWHVPTQNEWTALTDHIGGTGSPNGNKLKSCRQENSPLGGGCNTSEHPRWSQHSTHYGTDDYGFSGLPGGIRTSDGDFYEIGNIGHWFSSTEYLSYYFWGLHMYNQLGHVDVGHDYKQQPGFSVRCLRDNQIPPVSDFSATPISGTSPLTVYFTDESLNIPTIWHWNFGDGNTSTQQNPSHTYQDAGAYTVQLTVTNSYGSDTEIKMDYITINSSSDDPCPGMPTVTDIDGNIYNTVLIGSQCWMKENLKTTTYKNGTPIPNVTDATPWYNLTTGAYVWYDNDINWKDSYGALYNWYAVDDPNGLCPTGWHVPTQNEWTALTDHIGGTGSPNGNKLKSCRQVNSPLGGDCNTTLHPRWDHHSDHYGTDVSGFSGLPGGIRNNSGFFINIGICGYWWSSTEYSPNMARERGLWYNGSLVNMNGAAMRFGFSIRCLRDY